MQLASKFHTVGNRIRWEVRYEEWLGEGQSLAAGTVTSSSPTCTVDTVSITSESAIVFFLNGGVLNEQLTVSLVATSTDTEVANDTIQFTVVAP